MPKILLSLDSKSSWSDMGTILTTLVGNAVSATKLATMRTIWGQNFDGTGNIDGVFRALYPASYNGGIAHSILNNSQAPYGLITRIYGDGMVSLQAQRETTTSEYFRLALNPLGGNVTIGKTTADYKLDVNGTIRGTALRLGASPAIEWDAERNAFRVNGSIYATGEVTAKGEGSDNVPSGGGGGASYDRLDSWDDYTAAKEGYVLSAKLGWNLNTRLQNVYGKATIDSMLGNYVTIGSAQTITGLKTFNSLVKISTEGIASANGTILRNNVTWNNTILSATGGDLYLRPNGSTETAGEAILKTNGDFCATKFIKNGGTSAQFLKADGSVDGNNYIKYNQNPNAELKWVWGSNLTHVVGFEGGDTAALRVYNGAAIRAFANAVNKSGDTMSGMLTINNRLLISDAGKTIEANITSDNFFGVGGASNGLVNLGRSNARWATVYANAINVTSNALVSNLNADLLDGLHETSFLRGRGIASVNGENSLWSQIGIKAYHNALPDGLSGAYNYGEVISLPCGSARFDIYCCHTSSAGQGLWFRSGWGDDKKAWKRFACIDDNVASATKLANVRTIWGQNFNGEGNVSGDMTGVGSIQSSRGISLNPADKSSAMGDYAFWYGLGFNAGNIVTLGGFYGLKLFTENGKFIISQGGNVAVGKLTADYRLDVNGTANASMWRMSQTGVGENYIKGGTADHQATFYDDAKNTSANLEIYSHWGIAFKTSCSGQTRSGKIAVGIDTRLGIMDVSGYIRSRGKIIVGGGLIEFGDGYTLTVDKENGCFRFSHAVVSKNEVTALIQ